MIKKVIMAMTAAALLLAGCAKQGSFRIEGSLNGGADSTLYLYRASNGIWFPVDSAKVKSDGSFAIKADSPEYPDIYRLALGTQYVDIPIDSLETVTFTGAVADFATGYTLAGSAAAEAVMSIDRECRKLTSPTSPEAKAYKQKLMPELLKEPQSIVAYYAINKFIGREPLFDVTDRQERGVVCAVANAFKALRPDDPRTAMLEQMALGLQRQYRTVANPDTIVASQIDLIDITLPDRTGKQRSLAQEAAKGKVTVLCFTAYSLDNSAPYNQHLAKVYNALKERGVEIFQVGLDDDVAAWKLAAEPLPWITVYDENGVQSKNLMRYNVGAIPALFVIDRKGVLQERVDDPDLLQATITKYL